MVPWPQSIEGHSLEDEGLFWSEPLENILVVEVRTLLECMLTLPLKLFKMEPSPLRLRFQSNVDGVCNCAFRNLQVGSAVAKHVVQNSSSKKLHWGNSGRCSTLINPVKRKATLTVNTIEDNLSHHWNYRAYKIQCCVVLFEQEQWKFISCGGDLSILVRIVGMRV